MFPSQSQITNGNDPDQPTNKTQGENRINFSIYDAGEHQEPDSAVLIRDSYELKKSSKIQNTDPNSEADSYSPASQTIKAGRKHIRRFTIKDSKESTSRGRPNVTVHPSVRSHQRNNKTDRKPHSTVSGKEKQPQNQDINDFGVDET